MIQDYFFKNRHTSFDSLGISFMALALYIAWTDNFGKSIPMFVATLIVIVASGFIKNTRRG